MLCIVLTLNILTLTTYQLTLKYTTPNTTCLKCFLWCYYTITRQAIPLARDYQYQWLCKISSKYSLEFTLCRELEFGCEMSWNWVLLKVNIWEFFNFRLISFPELKDSHAADRSLLSTELFPFRFRSVRVAERLVLPTSDQGSWVRIPLEARFFPNLNGASLHRAFQLHPSIVPKGLKYCWRDVKP